jgi:CheY-like chemotaxis protein
MSKFVTLLVEDDAFQREILADVLKEEGFEVVECATAEAAELIVASSGTELRALIADHNLAGDVGCRACTLCAKKTPRHEHYPHVRNKGGACPCYHDVPAKALRPGSAARSSPLLSLGPLPGGSRRSPLCNMIRAA